MDKIIDAIVKLIPFSTILEQYGLNKELSSTLSVLLSAVLLFLLINISKIIIHKIKSLQTTKDLAPYFDEYRVRKSVKYFIQTHGQNISPTYEDETINGNKFIVRKKLIPWFIEDVFSGKNKSDKYFIVLADSGMGKTTFMINLFIKYNSVFNLNRKYKIKLLPFGDDRIIDQLKEMNKKRDEVINTILLLDAFDEYRKLIPPETPDGLTNDERFRKLLDEIVEITRDFREVVITSRTQYFPSQENQPYELKIPRFDDEGFHTLSKLYISPFKEKEIYRYLNIKYGVLKFWNFKKKKSAISIIRRSPKLMVRPMLLSYIEYLVDGNDIFNSTYDIYETLTNKWVEREANKRKYDIESRSQFKKDLVRFSEWIALEIYNRRKKIYCLSISKEDASSICKQQNIHLEDHEMTGQSLLTRDINHTWKFAHKSIYEFFIAKHANENLNFAWTLDFSGNDMINLFCSEKGISPFIYSNYSKIEDGEITMKFSNNSSLNIYPFPDQIYTVEYLEKINGFFILKEPVKNGRLNTLFSWLDAIEYCNSLNLSFGFPPNYDKEGQLIDSSKKKAKSTKDIKGFRLPTLEEWQYASLYLLNPIESDSKYMTFIERKDIKTKEIDTEEIEWCYYLHLDNSKSLSKLNEGFNNYSNSDFRGIICSNSKNTSSIWINKSQTKDMANIRVVFVP